MYLLHSFLGKSFFHIAQKRVLYMNGGCRIGLYSFVATLYMICFQQNWLCIIWAKRKPVYIYIVPHSPLQKFYDRVCHGCVILHFNFKPRLSLQHRRRELTRTLTVPINSEFNESSIMVSCRLARVKIILCRSVYHVLSRQICTRATLTPKYPQLPRSLYVQRAQTVKQGHSI